MIVIELKSDEAFAWEEFNSMSQNEARDFLFLQSVGKGTPRDEAKTISVNLSNALESARQKIEAARRYEIRVVTS